MMQSREYEISTEIKYLLEIKISITKIHRVTVNTTGDYITPCTPEAKLSVKFSWGRLSIEGNPRCSTSTTESIEKLVM
jgi:hypothetical protein